MLRYTGSCQALTASSDRVWLPLHQCGVSQHGKVRAIKLTTFRCRYCLYDLIILVQSSLEFLRSNVIGKNSRHHPACWRPPFSKSPGTSAWGSSRVLWLLAPQSFGLAQMQVLVVCLYTKRAVVQPRLEVLSEVRGYSAVIGIDHQRTKWPIFQATNS